MNDYEMMNQRVDQLRLILADMNHGIKLLESGKKDIMTELLDTRRQITRADKKALADFPAPCMVDDLH